MTPAVIAQPRPVYRCEACDARWTYLAVRHVARCRDCGSGLVRVEEPRVEHER
jgi:DNA-directed RNA polymerase subunit RPC12/RpoP